MFFSVAGTRAICPMRDFLEGGEIFHLDPVVSGDARKPENAGAQKIWYKGVKSSASISNTRGLSCTSINQREAKKHMDVAVVYCCRCSSVKVLYLNSHQRHDESAEGIYL